MALNGRVLLLNQTYEPLGTVRVARAIIMTFKNTVFVEEWDGDRVLRSARDEFPVPILERNDVLIWMIRSRRTGYVHYEDEVQIFARPYDDVRRVL